MGNTKETILLRALDLFSKNGYGGVSVREIASAVGIKESSLYKHYKNKQDIFDSIMQEMSRRYDEAQQAMHMPAGDSAVDAYLTISADELVRLATSMFLYFLKDDYAAKYRRMLIIEQFHQSKAGETFRKFLIDGPLYYHAILFSNMMQRGGFISADPYAMALHFYAPLFLLFSKYDNLPEKESEAVEMVEIHVRQFVRLYATNTN